MRKLDAESFVEIFFPLNHTVQMIQGSNSFTLRLMLRSSCLAAVLVVLAILQLVPNVLQLAPLAPGNKPNEMKVSSWNPFFHVQSGLFASYIHSLMKIL